jgi:putative transposase
MPNYLRNWVAGGTYFFTVVTQNRSPIFRCPEARTILGTSFRDCLGKEPFTVNAVVLLPDHLHTLWTLPPGDKNYDARWKRIKSHFTHHWLAAGGAEGPVTRGKRRERRRGVWQRRYWEHTVVDEDDFSIRFDYIHYNPVKHRYVRCPADWQESTFHRWVDAGVYQSNWACGDRDEPPDFAKIIDRCGEP